MPDLSNVEQTQKTYYNAIAGAYDRHFYNRHVLNYRHGLYRWILGDLDLTGMRVLDALCGGGENTAYFIDRAASVEGVDISDEQCRIYAERFPNCKVTCESVIKTHYDNEMFDFVVADSLHHLHPSLDKGVAEIVRVLRPGGYLLLWEPSAGSILNLARKAWYKLDRKYFETNERAIDLREVVEYSKGGLKPLRRKYGGGPGYVFVNGSMQFRLPIKLLDYIAPPLYAIERCLAPLQGKFLSCWVLALLRKTQP